MLERRENGLQAIGCNADPGVGYGDLQSAFSLARAERHRSGGGKLDRIAQQVQDNLPQPQRVPADQAGQIAGDFKPQVQPALLRQRKIERDAATQHMAQVERLLRRLDIADFDFRNVENVVEQAHHRLARFDNQFGVAPLGFRQVAIGEQFGKAQNPVHGRAYFVAHVCQEPRFDQSRLLGVFAGGGQVLFQPDPVGDIADRGDDPHDVAAFVARYPRATSL